MRGWKTIGALATLAVLHGPAASGASTAETICLTTVNTKEASRARIAPCTMLLNDAKTDSERVTLLLARSEAYYQSGGPVQALLDLDRIARIGGMRPQIFYDRALLYAALDLYARAEPDIDTAMRSGVHTAEAYGVRGRINAYQGRYGDAIEDLELSIASKPTLANSYAVRGFANIEIGEIERAITDLDTAIRLDPKSDFAYIYRGRAHLALDQYTEALADLEEALRLNPDDSGASDYIAHVRAMMNAPAPQALADADPNMAPSRAVGTSHNCMAYYPFLSNWTGEAGDVLIHYDVAADGAISGVGIDRSSGYDKLDRAAVICVSRHWHNTPAMQNGVAVASPHHQAIIRYSNHLTGPQMDLRRGETFAGLGNYPRALAALTAAASEDPANAEIFVRRGLVFYVTQDYRAAIQDFDTALHIKPGDGEAAAGRELTNAAVAASLAPGSKGI